MRLRRQYYLTGFLTCCGMLGMDAFVSRTSNHRCSRAVNPSGLFSNQQQHGEAINGLNSAEVTFRTPPMHVYIEYTDAFGVIYNGNYLKFFDRALYHYMTMTDIFTNDWSIVSVSEQKFKQSPTLGGTFVIEGVRKQHEAAYEIWDMDMKSVDGTTVFNSVRDVRIVKPTGANKIMNHVSSLKTDVDHFEISDDGKVATDRFVAYRDEFEPHLQGTMPLRNVLNLFERSRTNYLGGPCVLRDMQENEGILFVVTHIEDAWLVGDGATCCAGDEVTVETISVVKRNGMVLDCYQTLKRGAERLAQAKTRVMVLNATTMRPTNKLPESLRITLGL